MHTYAVIDNKGVITNIIVTEVLVKDTATEINIDDAPWLRIGDPIDRPNPTPDANEIIGKRLDRLDGMFESIEKEQFRSLCSIVNASLTGKERSSKDENLFLYYEKKKAALRGCYPVEADGTEEEWLNSVIEKIRSA